jgi:hypothetical protein
MKLFWKTTILLTLISCGTTVIPLARAEHATTFLNALQTELTNRLANPPTNSTPAQRKALATANKTLSRTSKTLAADLSLFASAATTLNRPFAGDDRFAALESQVIELYSAEARARVNWLVTHVGTNGIARSASNQLAQARNALDRAGNGSNSVPVRARVLATAFTKLGLADTQIRRTIKAAASLADKGVLLSEDAIVNEQTNFYLDHAGGTGIYNVDNPEELGLLELTSACLPPWASSRSCPTFRPERSRHAR